MDDMTVEEVLTAIHDALAAGEAKIKLTDNSRNLQHT